MKEPKELNVYYYAVLKEKSGKTEEDIESIAATPLELYKDLARKYDFPLDSRSIRVSINEEFQSMDTALCSGDRVIFIPPVAGG
jgi:molybdopterin converting factor small subunit